ncbi:MAG: hypothetical protein ACPGWR_13250 [Ardenticatenaceae bacterium]
MDEQTKKKRTLWHRLLGDLLKLLLAPVGITVHIEQPLMTESPRVDILLLKREQRTWTAEQLLRLPDGLRSSQARHLILEFKYTESLTLLMIQKICGYLAMYQGKQKLQNEDVELFIISAKTPQKAFRSLFQYSEAEARGVYRSTNPVLERIHLICLNELKPEPHNAFIKCFASRSNEKRKAFSLIRRELQSDLSTQLYWFIKGLWEHWFKKGKAQMGEPLTTEKVLEIGKMWTDDFFSIVPPEEAFSHYKPEDAARFYKPQEMARFYKPEELLSGLPVEEIEAYLRRIKSNKNSEQNEA